MDTEKQRQCRCDDARLTESQKRAVTRGACRVAKEQRMALQESSWASKARLVFRNEISDSFHFWLVHCKKSWRCS